MDLGETNMPSIEGPVCLCVALITFAVTNFGSDGQLHKHSDCVYAVL